MIQFENTQIVGWEPAIRGMRNPYNSWEKSDSLFFDGDEYHDICGNSGPCSEYEKDFDLGCVNHDLMMRLSKAGIVDAKFRRMIVVYVDITAPLYWWKEFDTYKVGTVANSCSTMHKIHSKPFELDDFSYNHLINYECYAENEAEALVLNDCPNVYCGGLQLLYLTINTLNFYRERFNQIGRRLKENKSLTNAKRKHLTAQQKRYWWQMIQLLPSSYNQERTVMLNYEVLAGIYPKRKKHKLDEWHVFCD